MISTSIVRPNLHSTLSGRGVRTTSWNLLPPALRNAQLPQPYAPSALLEAHTREPWLDTIEYRLKEIANLSFGWDDAGAQPIDPGVLDRVTQFVESDLVVALPVKPSLVPTTCGGMLVEWHTESVDLVIELEVGEVPSFYFSNTQTGEEEEGPLAASPGVIANAFARLAA